MPSLRHGLFSAWTAICAAAAAAALVGAGREAFAQVVQLPSVQSFGYSGAVSVPESGQSHLGGVTRQRSGASSTGGGPVAGRTSGSQTGGTTAGVSATIIDLQAMDAAILNEPAAKRPANYRTRAAGAPVMNMLTPHLNARRMGADQLAPPSDPNAYEIALAGGLGPSTGPASAVLHDDSEVRYYMQRAKEAGDSGHTAAAVVYYRMAYQRLTPAQRTRLQEFQAKAAAETQQGEAGSTAGAATAGARPAAASAAADEGNAPAASAAGSAAGEVAPAGGADADPFASPF